MSIIFQKLSFIENPKSRCVNYIFLQNKQKMMYCMNKLIFFILVLFSQLAYSQSSYTYMGTFSSNGVPNYLAERDIVTPDFVARINASFPERYPVPSYNPQYITNGIQTNIELKENADVWVTFVSEGAGYMNVLGYYTYDVSNPSQTPPNKQDIKIIFPNVSALGSGGGLIAGDKVNLGSFSAGTGIAWVLLANAWKGGITGVGAPLWTLYSNRLFNPESIDSQKFHNVLLYDAPSNRIVLGFEDIRRDYSSCDNDFNDAIFYVTATPNSAIALNNINETAEVGTEVSSGNDGGLESNGSLAEKIALRNIKKDLTNINTNSKAIFSNKNLFSIQNFPSALNGQSLDFFFPIIGNDSSIAYLSSPLDLLEITNAVDVLSADYFKFTDRTAVMLATKTLTEVYNHTKSICDRVGGSNLENVKLINILGKYPTNLIALKKNNTIEYAISFSMRNISDNTYEYNSHWNIENFPKENMYLNFQLWGNKPADVFFLAEEVLKRLEQNLVVLPNYNYSPFPSILMKSGSYSQGKFKMDILNSTKTTGILKIDGTYRASENRSSNNFSEQIFLNGQTTQKIELPTKGVFDAGLVIRLDGQQLQDNIYLADGAWVANYENQNVKEVLLKITPQDGLISSSEKYWVERGFEAKGKVKNYYSVHRPLRLGLNPVDLNEFNYLVFTASGMGEVEIVVSRNGIKEWNYQSRIRINLSNEAKIYSINLNNLKGAYGLNFIKTDIKALTFSIIGNNQVFEPFDFKFNQLAFQKTSSCESNKEIISTTYSAEKYQSQGVIKVKNSNKSESNTSLTATKAIEFLPGFTTENGAVFKAEIGVCENVEY